jgi:uncharacterized protein YdeI (YjbR/CyaY-like superfamily)
MASPRFFALQAEFRTWLAAHHTDTNEVIIGFYRKASGKGGLRYKEALDESLCFGWIDGVRRTIDSESYSQRFTPRRKGSNWSAVNLKRFAELRDAGLVEPAGLAAFQAFDGHASGYSYESGTWELSAEFVARLRAEAGAWTYWEARPPGYRRLVTNWVMNAKRQDTRERRIATLIEDCEAGRPIALLRRNTS